LSEDELGSVAVAVDAECATSWPSMLDHPEHGFAAKLVEAILHVDEEYCQLWV
jgi:hypothetical protein